MRGPKTAWTGARPDALGGFLGSFTVPVDDHRRTSRNVNANPAARDANSNGLGFWVARSSMPRPLMRASFVAISSRGCLAKNPDGVAQSAFVCADEFVPGGVGLAVDFSASGVGGEPRQ